MTMRIDGPSSMVEGKVGMIGGMILSVTQNLYVADLLRTSALALIGTLVSFIFSLILQWAWKRIEIQFFSKEKRKKRKLHNN